MPRFKSTGEEFAESFFGGLANAASSIPGSVRQSRDDERKRKLQTFEALQGIQRDEQRRQQFNQGMERLRLNFLKTKFQVATDRLDRAKGRRDDISFKNAQAELGPEFTKLTNAGVSANAARAETRPKEDKSEFGRQTRPRNVVLSIQKDVDQLEDDFFSNTAGGMVLDESFQGEDDRFIRNPNINFDRQKAIDKLFKETVEPFYKEEVAAQIGKSLGVSAFQEAIGGKGIKGLSIEELNKRKKELGG